MEITLPEIPADGRLVVLTGAGISKESGLDTFRDVGGLWQRYSIEDVATPEAFARDPETVHTFYNARRGTLLDTEVKPNPAHEALVRLERAWPGEVLVVTQNVDDLHDRAGSRNLIHMHGELLRVLCLGCGDARRWTAALDIATPCPSCGRTGTLRPDVVWFGEMPKEMDRIGRALAGADLFVSIGTSGNVYPAAGFVHEAIDAGAVTVEINPEPSDGATLFEHCLRGPAGTVVPALVGHLLERRTGT